MVSFLLPKQNGLTVTYQFTFSNKVDTDTPYYRVDVTGDEGLLVFSRYWPRGSQIFIQDGSDKYEETKDNNGVSWLDAKATNYKVKYLDPNKDAKLKEEVALSDSDTTLNIDKPKPRGRGKTTKQE